MSGKRDGDFGPCVSSSQPRMLLSSDGNTNDLEEIESRLQETNLDQKNCRQSTCGTIAVISGRVSTGTRPNSERYAGPRESAGQSKRTRRGREGARRGEAARQYQVERLYQLSRRRQLFCGRLEVRRVAKGGLR